MNFENTPEYIQSIKMRPACDRVLCEYFKITPDKIKRFDRAGELFILDREFHVDLIATLPNDSQLTGQEKALTFENYKYRTFTIEFYQNRHTKEKGEFFKIASQFYLHGYSDSSGIEFKEWVILDMLKFMYHMKGKPISELEKNTRPARGSNACFYWIHYKNIPPECFLYRSNNENLLFF